MELSIDRRSGLDRRQPRIVPPWPHFPIDRVEDRVLLDAMTTACRLVDDCKRRFTFPEAEIMVEVLTRGSTVKTIIVRCLRTAWGD